MNDLDLTTCQDTKLPRGGLSALVTVLEYMFELFMKTSRVHGRSPSLNELGDHQKLTVYGRVTSGTVTACDNSAACKMLGNIVL